jgi:hypothetical protein
VVYQYSFKRAQHDNRAINAMVERAEKVAAGERPLKKDRFVSLTDSSTSVNGELVERARSLKGIKGYVTNIDATVMDGPAVVAAYHDLYQVERSFRGYDAGKKTSDARMLSSGAVEAGFRGDGKCRGFVVEDALGEAVVQAAD